MPELAEVEYYRRQWDVGLGRRIARVSLHRGKRLFRGSAPEEIERALTGAKLLGSEAHGKQMLLRFSRDAWLGVHLGMTGELRVESAGFVPGKHDHLVLHQRGRSLVFSDARMFGRVRFHRGKEAPRWWSSLPPAVTSRAFTIGHLRGILQRRARVPLKALLLMQEFFPGVGNWMADEILWRLRLHPRTPGAALDAAQQRALWTETRQVCRVALRTIGVDWGDPPRDWLIHVRWKKTGRCPRHRIVLERATIGGRTTAWCARCQKFSR
jgi:formamidopyrimidine-DNA glycosylase